MRLLDTTWIRLTEVQDHNVPPYAILSHTWEEGEVLLQDIDKPELHEHRWDEMPTSSDIPLASPSCVFLKAGFAKLRQCAGLAWRNGFQYIWVDTCCIDKSSSAELSEAINSMYRWYQEAAVCYAYLADALPAGIEDITSPKSSFRRSRWFTRGWTLQELIAARQLEFFAGDWSELGSKTQSNEFTELISDLTGIQVDVLTTLITPADISVASRMSWAAGRQTTRVEDMAYCLLGIFDVNMPLLYGEGKKAFIRLQEEILIKDDQDQSLFAWHTNQQTAALPGASDNRLSGLLAESPDQFWDAGDLDSTMPLTFSGNPSAVTSKGLRVDLLLLPISASF
ncbi:heterokaryon incompatibility protein-domain-containing protein [Xylariales sp. PMI_506]|nr:heterokaryon incompatibility protein-domain-containing protein [Xylariales sp. PMI_506]